MLHRNLTLVALALCSVIGIWSPSEAQDLDDPISFFGERELDPRAGEATDKRAPIEAPVALRTIEGLVRIDRSGTESRFSSRADLARWVSQRLRLEEGQRFLLFEQTIGQERGLLILVGNDDLIEELQTFLSTRRKVEIPSVEAPSRERVDEARGEAVRLFSEVAETGRSATRERLEAAFSAFNTASAMGPDVELTARAVKMLRGLSRRSNSTE